MNYIEMSDKMMDVEIYAERIEALMGLIDNCLFKYCYNDLCTLKYNFDRLMPVYDVMMCVFSDLNDKIKELSDFLGEERLEALQQKKDHRNEH